MISLLYAHPYSLHAREDQWLLNAVQHWPGLELRDLYQLYPDFYIDVATEQKMLSHSNAIILHYPLQWGLPPALLVQYLHKVFVAGWAFGQNSKGEVSSAVQGVGFWLVAQTVGQGKAPDSCDPHSLFKPMQQLADACGMHWHRPLILPPLADTTTAAEAAERYRSGLQQLALVRHTERS
ncbi:NAD(P)H-dependent oxidoreductase [Rheinheimera sp.]|uniref:NAD(P)H-dependent oxidoreductase n=1 Tax=Rheinheimera sp. TaxID=1869214 RepID=UPI00307CEAEE